MSILSFRVSYTDEEILDLATHVQLYGCATQLTQDVITIEDDDINVKRQTNKKKAQKVKNDEVEEGKFCVKVALIGQIGKWIEREDYIVVNFSLAPHVEYVKRGCSKDKGRYIKLTDIEKQLAVAHVTSLISQGSSVWEAIKALQEMGHLFSNVMCASVQKWEKCKLGV